MEVRLEDARSMGAQVGRLPGDTSDLDVTSMKMVERSITMNMPKGQLVKEKKVRLEGAAEDAEELEEDAVVVAAEIARAVRREKRERTAVKRGSLREEKKLIQRLAETDPVWVENPRKSPME